MVPTQQGAGTNKLRSAHAVMAIVAEVAIVQLYLKSEGSIDELHTFPLLFASFSYCFPWNRPGTNWLCSKDAVLQTKSNGTKWNDDSFIVLIPNHFLKMTFLYLNDLFQIPENQTVCKINYRENA